jgi:hypothetical protein
MQRGTTRGRRGEEGAKEAKESLICVGKTTSPATTEGVRRPLRGGVGESKTIKIL